MNEPVDNEITVLLGKLSNNDDLESQDQLIKYLYLEMRKLAGLLMARESAGHTFQATELVNEAYLKIFSNQSLSWNDRKHFYANAVVVMRRILVDHARKKIAGKRIPKTFQDPYEQVNKINFTGPSTDDDIIKLDDALEVLAKLDPRQAKIVELRYFAGFTETEIAEHFQLSRRTITREWQTAKRWLKHEMYS